MELSFALGILAVMILICLFSSKLSSWFNMPCLLLFLVVGMLAGSDGIGGIAFDNAKQANYIGSTAMAFILFSGGFDTKWSSVKSVMRYGGILSSIGVLLTALFVGVFCWFFFRWQYPEKHLSLAWCLLLGSIISSTDAAAVFAILRSRSVSLRGKLQPLLEFESGSNDPMAAFLTIFMLGVVTVEAASGTVTAPTEYLMILPNFLLKMSLGIGWGLLCGNIAVWVYNRIDFEYDGLYYVLAVVAVMLSFSSAELCRGNGFMAVYVAGMVMGNGKFVFHNGIGKFYDGFAWLMQVILFAMLGLLAFPPQIWDAKWTGLAVAFFLMIAARPLAVFLCLIGSHFSFRERTLVSWVGLRGGAPIMLATFPLMAGISGGNLMFHVVFFIVLSSVLIQGMTIMPVARLLRLDAPLRKSPRSPLSFEHTGTTNAGAGEFEVLASSGLGGKTLSGLGLPRGALVMMIRRDDEFIIPQGDTPVADGDVLTIVGSDRILEQTALVFEPRHDSAAVMVSA